MQSHHWEYSFPSSLFVALVELTVFERHESVVPVLHGTPICSPALATSPAIVKFHEC
jgi:hypothetical protein